MNKIEFVNKVCEEVSSKYNVNISINCYDDNSLFCFPTYYSNWNCSLLVKEYIDPFFYNYYKCCLKENTDEKWKLTSELDYQIQYCVNTISHTLEREWLKLIKK